MAKLKSFVQFNETASSVELTMLEDTPVGTANKLIASNWMDGVYYKGMVIDDIYSIICNAAEKELDPNKTGSGQEVYLGYIPDTDLFVSGWDTWVSDSDDESNLNEFIGTIAFVKIDKNKKTTVKSIEGDVGVLIYPSVYKRLKNKYSKILDLRLD